MGFPQRHHDILYCPGLASNTTARFVVFSSDSAYVDGHVGFCYCCLGFSHNLVIFRLHRMHEMLTIVADVCSAVCLSCGLNQRRRVQCTPCAVCTGSFSAAFAKCFWPLVRLCFWFHTGQVLSCVDLL